MSLNSLDLGGGGNAFSFDTPGDSVTGKIIGLEEQQQTDMQTGMPAVWENGQPKMMVRVDLETTLRNDASDDGGRSVYLKGSRKPESKSTLAAVLTAVRNASGATTLSVGGTLTLTYVGDGVPSRKGYNAPKQYEATYVAPSVDLGGEATPQQQTPAPAPQQAPQANPAPAPAPQVSQAPAGAPAPAAGSANEDESAAYAAFLQWQQKNGAPQA